MTTQLHKPISAAKATELSPLMQTAYAALGGTKHWTGRVRGLAGLIRRTFDIDSAGHFENGQLMFYETLKFDDGETNQREWTIFERQDGLHIEEGSVNLVRPGQLERDVLIFIYRLNLGRFSLRYRDIFRIGPQGDVENTGFATFLGLRILKIEATGRTAR